MLVLLPFPPRHALHHKENAPAPTFRSFVASRVSSHYSALPEVFGSAHYAMRAGPTSKGPSGPNTFGNALYVRKWARMVYSRLPKISSSAPRVQGDSSERANMNASPLWPGSQRLMLARAQIKHAPSTLIDLRTYSAVAMVAVMLGYSDESLTHAARPDISGKRLYL